MVKISNLNKKYSENIGNFDINLTIPDGKVYGIIGPNGAGKSTMIRQILGFIRPDSGEIIINEVNPVTNSKKLMEFTGYVSGEVSLYNNMTGIKYLKLVHGLKKDADWDFVELLLKHFDINANQKIKKMSKGMKQKIALICATMNKPKFLVLDEPTSGLDPIMQEQFNDLIRKLQKDYGTTVLICSHIFEEVAKLCSQVGFIKDGRLIEEFEVEKNGIDQINERFKKLYTKESVL
ncbi:ABC transporter ATP-binding protein [Spiroplasma sabaudiense Ar-1343]|uniref:ABC transporter ATP-binding protein n=1 Tax=Spiroplasma sabaudiense Ar-1343 TaxID=1276257 RepID=W6ABE0_9MOLU|nr:ATP-binding cassette domain-containing protein [Spiroplasma sabaudiense]AHI54311.1 ABC transporter ATP-binding protein [Spiroplasma sabaudiense Ar-1343]